jgi:hypothetical protein
LFRVASPSGPDTPKKKLGRRTRKHLPAAMDEHMIVAIVVVIICILAFLKSKNCG